MSKKPARTPTRDPRDVMAKFDRLLAAMAPKSAAPAEQPKKIARRGKKKLRATTSPNAS